MDRRVAIERVLRDDGYTIVARSADVSDPFAWSLVARKEDYEILVQERYVALQHAEHKWERADG